MSTPALQFLSQAQVDKFYHDGYLVIPGFLSTEECEGLVKQTKGLLSGFDLKGHPLTKFTTGDNGDDSKHVGDDYFLTSGDKIRFFFEEDAFGPDGELKYDKEKAINKIGHGLHELDPVFRKVTLANPRLKALARDLAFHKDPAVLQSMVICKQSKIGAKVPEHNDSTFLYTSPPSALGFWFALEPCTTTNGSLRFLAGSHKTTPISKRFVRLPDGGTGFEDLFLDETQKEALERLSSQSENYVIETCDAGALVLIHGSVMHKSSQNTSSNTRFAYTFHMIESDPHAKYDEKNWLQPSKEVPFSKLFESS